MKKKGFVPCILFLAFLSCLSSPHPAAQDAELEAESRDAFDKQSSQITVKANVAKAAVFLNDIFQGVTNLTLTGLREGTYKLRVEKDGFVAENHVIQVESGESLTFFVELRQE